MASQINYTHVTIQQFQTHKYLLGNPTHFYEINSF